MKNNAFLLLYHSHPLLVTQRPEPHNTTVLRSVLHRADWCCLNDRMGATPSGHLALHVRDSKFKPCFSLTLVLFRSRDQKIVHSFICWGGKYKTGDVENSTVSGYSMPITITCIPRRPALSRKFGKNISGGRPSLSSLSRGHQKVRELKEAFMIKRLGRPLCISDTSVSLFESEISFLASYKEC